MEIKQIVQTASRMRQICGSLLACLMFLTATTVVTAQTLNDKVMKYVTATTGNRIGGGECTDFVSEALRIAGAAFTEGDLGEDYPEDGDRVWGTPIKVISFVKDKFVDSNPTTRVLPGDVLQYSGAKFVYVTTKGRKTTTRIVTADQHTSIVAKTDAKSLLPTDVYEQNGPTGTDVRNRELSVSSINFGSLKSGWVCVFRPKPRDKNTGKYRISVVNNTSAAQVANVKKGRNVVVSSSLNPTNTESSYSVLWFDSSSPDDQFKLVLPEGASIDVINGSGYEIFRKPSTALAIRRISP